MDWHGHVIIIATSFWVRFNEINSSMLRCGLKVPLLLYLGKILTSKKKKKSHHHSRVTSEGRKCIFCSQIAVSFDEFSFEGTVIFFCLIDSAPVIHLHPPPSSCAHGWFNKDEWNTDSRSLPSPGSKDVFGGECASKWCMKNDFLLLPNSCSPKGFFFYLWFYWGFFGVWTDWHYVEAAQLAYYNSCMQHSRLHCSWGEIEAAGSWMNITTQTWNKLSSSGGSTYQEEKNFIGFQKI